MIRVWARVKGEIQAFDIDTDSYPAAIARVQEDHPGAALAFIHGGVREPLTEQLEFPWVRV